MATPTTGVIAFSDLAAEVGRACCSVSLDNLSACLDTTYPQSAVRPDCISEFYNKVCSQCIFYIWESNAATLCSNIYGGVNSQNSATSFSITSGKDGNNNWTDSAQRWNGSTWCSINNLPVSIYQGAGGGSRSSSFATAGLKNSTTFNCCSYLSNSSGVWSLYVGIPENRANMGYVANINPFVFGGFCSTATSCSTRYNVCSLNYSVASWQTCPGLSVNREGLVGIGSDTSALAVGGFRFLTSTNCQGFDQIEEWNGSTWSTISCGASYKFNGSGGGTTTCAIFFGDSRSSLSSDVRTWNGSTWSTADYQLQCQHGNSFGTACTTSTADVCAIAVSALPTLSGFGCTETYNRTTICILS